MANKYETLDLINKGLSNKDIAERLNCLEAYVRAVRAREFGNGKATAKKYNRSIARAARLISWPERAVCRGAGRVAYHEAREDGKTVRQASIEGGGAYTVALYHLVMAKRTTGEGA